MARTRTFGGAARYDLRSSRRRRCTLAPHRIYRPHRDRRSGSCRGQAVLRGPHVLGLREWFETGPGGPLNYGPDGAKGSQLFFYQAEEPGTYSRHQTGLHHLAFLVASRAIVREAHQWACAHEAIILDEPREFPQYGEQCLATYWLDPHGFKLEAVCHAPEVT